MKSKAFVSGVFQNERIPHDNKVSMKHWHVAFSRLKAFFITALALSWQRSVPFRNQSNDLLRQSMDWFLYDRDRHERVNTLFSSFDATIYEKVWKKYLKQKLISSSWSWKMLWMKIHSILTFAIALLWSLTVKRCTLWKNKMGAFPLNQKQQSYEFNMGIMWLWFS